LTQGAVHYLGGADSPGEGVTFGVIHPVEKHWEPLQQKSICWSLSVCKSVKFGWSQFSSVDSMHVLICRYKTAMLPFVRIL